MKELLPPGVLSSFSTSQSGWYYMWIITMVGFIILGVGIERIRYIMLKSSKGRKQFMENLAILLKQQKYEEATALAQASTLPIGRVMHAIISNRDKGAEGMTSAFDEAFLTEAPRITRYLAQIGILANVATLLGLLGTIFGLMYTFDAVANKPAAERPKALADGIAVAMGTTFMGLTVAIPTMVLQTFLGLTSERVSEELEEKGMKVIHLLS